MMKTQEAFYLEHQVNGELTDAQTMQMLSLPEGDSTTPVQSDVPDIAAAEVKPEIKVEVVEVPKQDPVILAKDGVHTIPFERLAEARESERLARQMAAELQAQLDALKSAPVAKVETPEPVDHGDVFGDFSEEAIAKGVEKLVASKTAALTADLEARLAAVLAPLQEKQVESATDLHFSTINKAHPDVESVVPSQEFNNWIDSQPSVVRGSLKSAIEQGTALEVIEVLDAYKASTGKTVAQTPKVDVAAAAQAAIAKAQSAPPMSLSEIPAGANVVSDEVNAMMEMSSAGLMSKFDGKSPEQIMALMSRVL